MVKINKLIPADNNIKYKLLNDTENKEKIIVQINTIENTIILNRFIFIFLNIFKPAFAIKKITHTWIPLKAAAK